MEDNTPPPQQASTGEIILYRTDDGRSEIQMRAVDGTVWLTQSEMAELFDTSLQNISQRIQAILEENELSDATINSQLIVRQEGSRLVRREIQIFNLEMILAVGYRVRSPRGTQFRQWATTTLREYLLKGFVLNDERLKEPGGFDYFDELLERIRDIRASEKRFYQKVRDVFATSSMDYDKTSEVAKTFFATIQNKLLYAVTGHTAAELVLARCDSRKPNMGLTSWKSDKVRKGDVATAKNYLTADELRTLNLLTTQFLDFAELRATRRQQTMMADWVVHTDRFLIANDFGILHGAGKVSGEHMKAAAEGHYKAYDEQRRELEAARAQREEAADLHAALEAADAADGIDELEQAEEQLRDTDRD